MWALDQLPPLLHHALHPSTIVTYEGLVLRPEETTRNITNAWGVEVDVDEVLARMSKPSSVVGPTGISGVSGWKDKLSEDQISRILRTVHAFGLTFYSMDDEPNYDDLHDENLAQRIAAAGTA